MSRPDPEIERRLAAHPFLKGISPHHLELLALSAMPTEFDAGQTVFRAGDPANGFYLIETGTVVLEGGLNDREPVVIDAVSGPSGRLRNDPGANSWNLRRNADLHF